MQRHERDLDLIDVILSDCATLRRRLDFFGMSFEKFVGDHSEEGEIAYDAVMSPVYRIAEDALHLSSDVVAAYPDYPWNDIRGFRNFVAHGYREIDRSIAWKVVVEDIPALERVLSEYARSSSASS